MKGIEPPTLCLQSRCSTPELHPHIPDARIYIREGSNSQSVFQRFLSIFVEFGYVRTYILDVIRARCGIQSIVIPEFCEAKYPGTIALEFEAVYLRQGFGRHSYAISFCWLATRSFSLGWAPGLRFTAPGVT